MSNQARLYSGTAQWIRNHAAEFELPEPGETWKSDDVHESVKDHMSILRNDDIVRNVGWCPEESVNVFETNPAAYREWKRAREALENSDGFLPCGHDAFENLGDGRLKCKRTGVCGEIHDKDDVR